jgi:hypothetical protein
MSLPGIDVVVSGAPKSGTRSSTASSSPDTEFQSPDDARGIVHDCKFDLSDGPRIPGPDEKDARDEKRWRYEGNDGEGRLLIEGERTEVVGLVPGRRWSVDATSTKR